MENLLLLNSRRGLLTKKSAPSYNELDILYSNSQGSLLVSDIVLPATDGYIPIALCIAKTGFFGDGEKARWLSLKMMSCTTPDIGTLNAEGIYPAQYDVIISPPTLNRTHKNGSDYGYFSGNTKKIPALKDSKGNWNLTELGEKNQYAVTDVNGKKRTQDWLAAATAQPNWRTDATIQNDTRDAGYSPMACCCWRYHTLGTNQGDWYWPAVGEYSMVVAYRSGVENKLALINAEYSAYCIPILNDRIFLSTEYAPRTVYNVTRGGLVTHNIDKEDKWPTMAMLQY